MSKASEYICPCCGGGIVFDSSVQMLKCPYCENVYDIGTLDKYAKDLQADGTEDEKWEQNAEEYSDTGDDGLRIFYCNSCGGEIIAEATTTAMVCPYCDDPVVMLKGLRGQWKPDEIIPFKLDKNRAIEEFRKHLVNKRFLPKPFKENEHFEEIKGVYVPFWLFNSKIDASIRYKATKVRTWSKGNYDYTETSYYSVTRGGKMEFNNISIDGSSQMPDDLMESIEPFDHSAAVPFNTAYLAGYVADKYDVDDNKCVVRANDRIRASVEKAFQNDVRGYASVNKEGGNIDYHNAKAVYALYPVWILTTKYNGKNYIFAMNGQTGKFVGDLPLDSDKFWRWLCFGTAGSFIIGTILMMIVQYLVH